MPACRGATTYLADENTPVQSPATADLVERALNQDDGPLYVVAIGAITNVASALLLEPELAWAMDPARHDIRCANYVHRDAIFADLFRKLGGKSF
jgi:hypothetical protein